MRRRGWVRGVALGGAAVSLGVWSSGGRGREVDARLFRSLNAGWGPAADRVLAGITELGSVWASGTAATLLAAAGRGRAAGRAMGAASVSWLAGQGLKRLFGRPRPYEAGHARVLIGRPPAASWPSSHPAVLGSFLAVAGRELGLSRTIRVALAGLAALVGLSRTYLGVHYPADVAGGLVLGRAVASAWPTRS